MSKRLSAEDRAIWEQAKREHLATGKILDALKDVPQDARRKVLNYFRVQMAAYNVDWRQVVANGGPPCFHLDEDGTFCLRAKRWDGHDEMHRFVSISDLIRSIAFVSK